MAGQSPTSCRVSAAPLCENSSRRPRLSTVIALFGRRQKLRREARTSILHFDADAASGRSKSRLIMHGVGSRGRHVLAFAAGQALAVHARSEFVLVAWSSPVSTSMRAMSSA